MKQKTKPKGKTERSCKMISQIVIDDILIRRFKK